MNVHCLLKQLNNMTHFDRLQFVYSKTSAFGRHLDTPLSHCSVDGVLSEVTPLFDQTLLQVVDVAVQ